MRNVVLNLHRQSEDFDQQQQQMLARFQGRQHLSQSLGRSLV